MKRDEPPLEYLLDCSKASLSAFHLQHMNREANCRKEVNVLMNEWVEEAALALLGEWFEKYGEKLIEMAAKSPEELNGQLSIAFPYKLPNPPPRRDKQGHSPFRPPHRIYRKAEKVG